MRSPTWTTLIEPLVAELAPQLLAAAPASASRPPGSCWSPPAITRPGSAAKPAFAMLCGVAPLPASSGHDPAAPTQPWRRPASQPGPAHDRHLPAARSMNDQGLRREKDRRGTLQTRDHPLPETLPRPRGLLPDPPSRHCTSSRPNPGAHLAGSSIPSQPTGAQARSKWSTPRLNDLDRAEHRHMIKSGGTGLDTQGSIQGGEYTRRLFATACTHAGVTQSMGRTGSALDNAVAERFHSTLEFELLRGGALRHSSQGAGSGRRLPGGVQLGASALHLRDAFPGRLRAHPGRGGGMTIGCAARLRGRPSSLKGRCATASGRP